MEVEPKVYHGMMVSSTFTDLKVHRGEVIDAINRFGFRPNVMEYSGARSDGDVIDISLRMVRDSVAYLCVIGHKYGQTPVDPDRNPKGLSITELEFNEARSLGRPILLFLMSDDHPLTKDDVEPDPKKQKKLDAFRKQAKRIDPSKPAERVYETFASVDEFAKQAAIAVGLQAIQMAGRSDLPDRAIRDQIARFIDVRPDAKQSELAEAIERFEAGYRALQQQLAAIPVNDNRVTALKSDAEAALAEGDLDKARTAYREAAEAARDKAAEPVRTAADLKSAEADAHLLALDWQAADAAWAEAQAMLAGFDRDAAEALVEDAAERLEIHGEQYASAGAVRVAIERIRGLISLAEARGDEDEAARLRNNLGIALRILGHRTADPEGLRLLNEALSTYRHELTVRTCSKMPLHWAATQTNLGVLLQTLAERTGGPAGVRLVEDAAVAFQNALTIYNRDDNPAEWATTQNNLGCSLRTQGASTSDSKGMHLLQQAIAAFRDALTVYTIAGTPAEWAMTQNNLANALANQGARTGGSGGLSFLEQAITTHREVLTVRTRAAMPASWATTQTNIGLVFVCMAEMDADCARAHLLDAEAAFSAALEVYTPEHMARHHEQATRFLAIIRAKLAALDD